MRKILLTFILFIILSSMLLGAVTPATSKAVKIQGASGSVLHVSITPLSTQSTSFLLGMPFDIEEDLVQYGVMKEGRIIAKWSMVANTRFNLSVKADLLTSENTYGDKIHAELPYIMRVYYSFGYYVSANEISSHTGYLLLNNETGLGSIIDESGAVESTVTWTTDKWFKYDFMPNNIYKKGLSGSVDGNITFMFTEQSTKRITDTPNTVPEGNYSATVTIKLEATT